MFRCPHCAKVYRLPISPNHSIVATRDMAPYTLVEDNLFDNPGSKPGWLVKKFSAMIELNVPNLEHAVTIVRKIEKPYGFDEEIVMPCCNQVTTLVETIKAFERPEELFEADNLCGCGGELWMDRVASGRYALVCEECGWVKPGVVVNGS